MDAVNGIRKPDFLAVEVGPHFGDCLLWLAAHHPQGRAVTEAACRAQRLVLELWCFVATEAFAQFQTP